MSRQMCQPEHIPALLRQRARWVIWGVPGASRPKAPRDPKRPWRSAQINNPRTWGSFAQALACVQAGRCEGVGYVFTGEDGLIALDLDRVRHDPRAWRDALSLASALGTYAEWSPSGAGLHLIGLGQLPERAGCRARWRSLTAEIYTRGRYFTMTGALLDPALGELRALGSTLDLLDFPALQVAAPAAYKPYKPPRPHKPRRRHNYTKYQKIRYPDAYLGAAARREADELGGFASGQRHHAILHAGLRLGGLAGRLGLALPPHDAPILAVLASWYQGRELRENCRTFYDGVRHAMRCT